MKKRGKIKLRTVAETLRTIEDVANRYERGELADDRARGLLYGLQVAVTAHKVLSTENELARLEKEINEIRKILRP